MRQIGTIDDETDARRFADYLTTQGVSSRVDRDSSGWAVWIHHEDHVDRARAELATFRANPDAERYRDVAEAARAVRRAEQRREAEHERQSIDVRSVWGRSLWRSPVTLILIVGSMTVGILSNFGTDERVTAPLSIASYRVLPLEVASSPDRPPGAIVRDVYLASDLRQDLARGEFWRLITPIFIHIGPVHLLLNMYWLYLLGIEIEARRGSWRLAALVLASALVSNLAQYLYSGSPRFGGMSGVDLALFGYMWMKGLYEPELGLGLHPTTVLFLMLFLGFELAGGLPVLAHGAHAAGLAVGILVGIAPHLASGLRAEPD